MPLSEILGPVYNPNDTIALFNRGETYSLMRHHIEALADYERAFALNKLHNINFNQDIMRHLKSTRAVILSYLKRYAEAIKEFEQLMIEEPNDLSHLYNLAVAMTLGRGIVEAQTNIDQAYSILLKIEGSEKQSNKLYGLVV